MNPTTEQNVAPDNAAITKQTPSANAAATSNTVAPSGAPQEKQEAVSAMKKDDSTSSTKPVVDPKLSKDDSGNKGEETHSNVSKGIGTVLIVSTFVAAAAYSFACMYGRYSAPKIGKDPIKHAIVLSILAVVASIGLFFIWRGQSKQNILALSSSVSSSGQQSSVSDKKPSEAKTGDNKVAPTSGVTTLPTQGGDKAQNAGVETLETMIKKLEAIEEHKKTLSSNAVSYEQQIASLKNSIKDDLPYIRSEMEQLANEKKEINKERAILSGMSDEIRTMTVSYDQRKSKNDAKTNEAQTTRKAIQEQEAKLSDQEKNDPSIKEDIENKNKEAQKIEQECAKENEALQSEAANIEKKKEEFSAKREELTQKEKTFHQRHARFLVKENDVKEQQKVLNSKISELNASREKLLTVSKELAQIAQCVDDAKKQEAAKAQQTPTAAPGVTPAASQQPSPAETDSSTAAPGVTPAASQQPPAATDPSSSNAVPASGLGAVTASTTTQATQLTHKS